MVEKDDVGIVCRFPARRRSEQVEAFDTEPLEFGFVRTQSAYGVVSFHLVNTAKPGVHCQIFGVAPVSRDILRVLGAGFAHNLAAPSALPEVKRR